MFTAAAALIVCGALPVISTPELLIDIEESPSPNETLIGANESGMLVHGLNKAGGNSLWWTPWDGAPFLVIEQTRGPVISARLGEGFVLFASNGEGQSEVLRLSLGDQPRVETLASVPQPLRIIDSSSHVWWVDPNGTSTTDGTVSGTRLVAPRLAAEFQAGGSLYPQRFVDAGISFHSFKRAGIHGVAAHTSLYNELGERLIESTNCVAHAGGDRAWVGCLGDGGVWLYVTDGTPSGTQLRAGPRGNFLGFDLKSTSSDYFVGNVEAPPCTLVTATDGPPQPLPGCNPDFDRVFGDVLVNEHSARSLSPPSAPLELGPLRNPHAAGKRAVVATQSGYRLTDGTEAGTRVVPSEWPDAAVTASSSPRLLAANGDRALYATTRGVWVTDGTPAGTLRVGESAVFWGKRVLATQAGELTVFDPDAKSWIPPAGTLGLAHRSLIGRDGCKIFTVDEDRKQKTLALEGCIERVEPGEEHALLVNDLGSVLLVRDGRAIDLGGDVSTTSVRCGEERCWYLGVPDSGRQSLNSIELASGSVKLIASLDAAPGPFTLLGGSSLAALVENANGRLAIFKGGRQLNVDPEAKWLFVSDGRLAVLERGGVNLLADGSAPFRLFFVECARPIAMNQTGTTLHALCDDGATGTLRSGPLGGPLELVGAGLNPQLPQGDELAWSSVVRDDASLVRVASGKGSREFPTLHGTDFARVREGYVFAGNGAIPDVELWVARVPPQGCGCESGGGLSLIALAVLLGRRTKCKKVAQTGR